MLLLVSGATQTIKRHQHHPNLGCLLTPHTNNSFESMCGLPFACDNAAFSNYDENAFMRMLSKCKGRSPLFVTAPDKVSDAYETMQMFLRWQPIIKEYGFPVGFVLQDGQEKLDMLWSKLDAVFIGGSTEYKLSSDVRQLVREAKFRKKWVHMGRVNSFSRVQYAREIGCDSVDGSGFSMFPDKKIPNMLKFLESEQLCLQITDW